MKKIFSIFAPLVLCCAYAQGQVEEPPRGLLNFVNLIPGSTATDIKVNGKELVPGGMKAGAETGWFSLQAGRLEISVKSDKSRPINDGMELKTDVGTVIAIFLEPIPVTKPDDKPLPPKISLKAFRTFKAGAYGLKIISLSSEPNTFGFGSSKAVLKPFEMIEINTWRGEAFDVSSRGKVIGKIGDCPQKANYYVFIAPANDGTFFAAKANADQLGIRR